MMAMINYANYILLLSYPSPSLSKNVLNIDGNERLLFRQPLGERVIRIGRTFHLNV